MFKDKREKIGLISSIAYIVIMGIGMFMLKSSGLSYNDPKMVKVIVLAEIVMSILAFITYKKLNLNLFSTHFKFTKWLIPFILMFVLTILFLVFTGDFTNRFPLITLIAVTTLLVGFSEELMFRGIVLNVFLEKRSVLSAIVISAIIFALLHSVNILGGVPLAGVPFQLFTTFLFGLIFSCLFILIRNIIPLMIYHFLWDFSIVSQPLTHANVEWISIMDIIIQVIIFVPLLIYTVKFVRKNGISFK